MSNSSRERSKNIPLPDKTVDVIISNCVINLSADKDRVLREAFRVLNRAADWLSPTWSHAATWLPRSGRVCSRGWMHRGRSGRNEYRGKLLAAGFEQIEMEPTRVYRVEDAREFLSSSGIDVDAIAAQSMKNS